VREYSAYVQCANADTVTHALVDTLAQVQAQLIVGLTHRNYVEDLETLRREPTVQAILGGHDHKGRRGEVDGRLVIKAVSNARTAALVTFTWQNGKWSRTDTPCGRVVVAFLSASKKRNFRCPVYCQFEGKD